jgi:hypothetical protein
MVQSEDSIDQDMVYYPKDDMTQYSKNLKLNRVERKRTVSALSAFSDSELFGFKDSDKSGKDAGDQLEGNEMMEDSGEDNWGDDSGCSPHRRARSSEHMRSHRTGSPSWEHNFHHQPLKRKTSGLTKKQLKRNEELEGIYGQKDSGSATPADQNALSRKGSTRSHISKGLSNSLRQSKDIVSISASSQLPSLKKDNQPITDTSSHAPMF